MRQHATHRQQNVAIRTPGYEAAFRESVATRPSGKEGGRLFKNVTLIKAGRGNAADKHYYPAGVLKEAVDNGQFKGLKMYVDHPSRIDDQIQPERTVRDWAGLYDNVRFVREGERGGRVVGDLRVFRSNKWLSDLVEDLQAIKATDKLGISINGAGDTVTKEIAEAGGEKLNEVQNFRKLHSADVVTEAGAGGGFHTLQEAAKAARQEQTPMKTKREKLLAKIGEAAKEGKTAEVVKLTGLLQECDMPKGKKTKETKAPVVEAKDEDVEEADDEDVEEAADEDVEEAADEDVEESDDEDVEESDDDEEDVEESADEDDAATREAKAPKTSAAALRARFAGGTKKVEQTEKVREGKTKAKGVPTKGSGSFVKRSTQTGKQKGRRYAETDVDTSEIDALREAVEQLQIENRELKSENAKRVKEAAASKIVKSMKGLKPEAQAQLVKKLVRESRTLDDMKSNAGFYMSLLESSRDVVMSGFEDDEIEGAPARIREAFGHETDDDPEALLAEFDLPVKAEARG